jgi:hypothetical protein
MRMTGQAGGRKQLLHPCVGCDDRRARIRVRVQIVKRLVEERLELPLEDVLLEELSSLAPQRPDGEEAENREARAAGDDDRQPLEVGRLGQVRCARLLGRCSWRADLPLVFGRAAIEQMQAAGARDDGGGQADDEHEDERLVRASVSALSAHLSE